VDLDADELAAKVAKRNAEAFSEWERKVAYAESDPGGYWAQSWLPGNRFPREPQGEECLNAWDRREYRVTGTRTFLRIGGWTTVKVEDGRYSWETHHHWLGESLVKARLRVNHLNKDGSRAWKFRTAYFLSGFDHAERRPLYFLCELPKVAKPTTIAEAYEALKPQAVLLAEGMGRSIVRQGDIFSIQLGSGTTKRTLRKAGATFVKRGNLLSTNHETTEVAYLPDGTTLARGIMYHNPRFRAPDHARRKLSEGWNVVIKNTVPTTKGK